MPSIFHTTLHWVMMERCAQINFSSQTNVCLLLRIEYWVNVNKDDKLWLMWRLLGLSTIVENYKLYMYLFCVLLQRLIMLWGGTITEFHALEILSLLFSTCTFLSAHLQTVAFRTFPSSKFQFRKLQNVHNVSYVLGKRNHYSFSSLNQ